MNASVILRWFYGLASYVIGGVASAVLAVPAGQLVGSLDFTARQLGAVALGAGVVAAAAYLKQSPLPKFYEE